MALGPSIFGIDLLSGKSNILTRNLATFGLISPEWGVFNRNGKSVITADNVVSFEYKQEWTLSDYPIEKGGFESYDKVQTPFDARVRFGAGGSLSNRKKLLDSIAAIAGDLKLYDVITPEKSYTSVNIMHYDLARTAQNGAGFIIVDVWLMEVRVDADIDFSSTQQPSGAPTSSGGQVQPQTVDPAKQAAINTALENAYQTKIAAGNVSAGAAGL